jgi:Tfp pilus assembly protein PilF
MKKISITFLVAGLLLVSAIQAQSIQDGVKDLYAERFKSAKATFEKLIAANPNNIDATYWLGQTHIAMEDTAGAKQVYEKALLASANAPLVIVGMGEVELMQNKVSEARQRFETAITMTKGRKGNDPVILNAVGRAITQVYNDKTKVGDINYGIQKLEEASQQKIKDEALMADIYLNLGDAYRKAKPGESGGLAYQNYQKAIDVNPNFAVPYHRMAHLFNTQRNWDLYEKYLNDAIAKDSRFAPAYYDLYYFRLLNKQDFAGAEEFAKKFIANTDPDPQNDYLRIQTLWAKKDFDGAISGAKNLVSQAGNNARPPVYKLIADSYLQKKDTAAAKDYVDQYFAKVKPDKVTALDYKLKADVYSVIPGQEEVVFNSYMEGLKADTVLENKVELLKKGAEFFKNRGQREKEGDLLEELVKLKPKPTINEMFDVGRAYYFGAAYEKSYNAFVRFSEKYPEEVFGWEWKLNNAKIIDSTKQDSIAVPDALKLLEFSQKDSVKYQKQYISAASFLAIYYANKAGDKAKAIEYLKRWQNMDPANKDAIQKNIDILSKAMIREKDSPAGAKNS